MRRLYIVVGGTLTKKAEDEFYDDLLQLDQRKHASGRKDARGNRGGGSNYAMADGSTLFLKFGKAFSPFTLWALVPDVRNKAITF